MAENALKVLFVLLLAGIALCGCTGPPDGGNGTVGSCAEGAILSRCRCGTQIAETGYCCNGSYSAEPCSGSEQKEPIQFLRELPLESGWARREPEAGSYEQFFSNSAGNTAIIVLENDGIICKNWVMPGIEPKAEYIFASFEPGTDPKAYPLGLGPRETFFFEEQTVLAFTKCGDEYPSFIRAIFEELGKMEDTSLPEKELDFLREHELPEGWEQTEEEFSSNAQIYYNYKKANPANITFKNNALPCNAPTVRNRLEKLFTFSFYRKGSEPTFFPGRDPNAIIQAENHVIMLFSNCWDDTPDFIQELIDGLEGIE